MYEEFYGLREKPFNKTPDPRFLYQSRKHAEALARLQLAVEEQDIVLLDRRYRVGQDDPVPGAHRFAGRRAIIRC